MFTPIIKMKCKEANFKTMKYCTIGLNIKYLNVSFYIYSHLKCTSNKCINELLSKIVKDA